MYIRVLKGTTDTGLVYHRDMSCALTRSSDSYYAIDLDVRRFVTEYAFIIDNSLVN